MTVSYTHLDVYKRQLKSFRITEDKEPLFTGTAAGLVCAESKNPERVRLLAPRIEQFKLQRSDYELSLIQI